MATQGAAGAAEAGAADEAGESAELRQLLDRIADRSCVVGVMGLGYVGLPLANTCAPPRPRTFPPAVPGRRGAPLSWHAEMRVSSARTAVTRAGSTPRASTRSGSIPTRRSSRRSPRGARTSSTSPPLTRSCSL